MPTLRKRSISLAGHATSLALEPEFWAVLDAMAAARETSLAQLIAEGASNKMIARSLNISIKTVESHRAAAMRKAGARTAAAFVRFAIQQNLIMP